MSTLNDAEINYYRKPLAEITATDTHQTMMTAVLDVRQAYHHELPSKVRGLFDQLHLTLAEWMEFRVGPSPYALALAQVVVFSGFATTLHNEAWQELFDELRRAEVENAQARLRMAAA